MVKESNHKFKMKLIITMPVFSVKVSNMELT